MSNWGQSFVLRILRVVYTHTYPLDSTPDVPRGSYNKKFRLAV